MTTITLETIAATERMLTERLDGLTATLGAERDKRTAQLEQIRDTAVQYGNDNGIDSDLDELLVAIGLAPRPVRTTVTVQVHYQQSITRPYDVRYDGGDRFLGIEDTGYAARPVVSWENNASATIDLPPECGTRLDHHTRCWCAQVAALPIEDIVAATRATGYKVLPVTNPDVKVTAVALVRCGSYECTTNDGQPIALPTP